MSSLLSIKPRRISTAIDQIFIINPSSSRSMRTLRYTWLLLLALMLQHSLTVASCVKPKDGSLPMDVFFVNLDHSAERRTFMIDQLRFYNLLPAARSGQARVPAVTPRHFILPNEISTPYACQRLSNASINEFIQLNGQAGVATNQANGDAHMLITAHCGRPKNTRREMAVTISHLRAIKAATDNIQSAHPYALILEDDMEFAFDIDFMQLIASAPKGFGILQLITSNSYDVTHLWQQYRTKRTQLWTLRTYHDLWCAGAYIINKDILRPLVNNIFRPLGHGWTGVSIIAGYDKPCTPSFCCRGGLYVTESPCFRSARGYQSDHFIFSLTEGASYILHVPIVSGARSGNRSTLHQDHVPLHVEAFRRINAAVDEIRAQESLAPAFIMDRSCKYQRNASTTTASHMHSHGHSHGHGNSNHRGRRDRN